MRIKTGIIGCLSAVMAVLMLCGCGGPKDTGAGNSSAGEAESAGGAETVGETEAESRELMGSGEATDVNVGLIMGPPSMGLGYMIHEAKEGNTYNNYSFTVEGIDYSALSAKLNQGDYDTVSYTHLTPLLPS